MKTIKTLAVLIIVFIIASCNSNKQTNNSNSADSTEIIKSLKDLTAKWNDCLVKKDIQSLKILYADQVSVYGKTISLDEVISGKEKFFKKYTDFNQSITGDIIANKISDNQYKLEFPKRSTFNNKTTDVQGYLIFEKISDNWKIINESDLVTDDNLSKKSTSKGEIPKDAVHGDYNGDGTKEYMWVVPPKVNYETMDCNGDCNFYIKFSDPEIPSIKVAGGIGGIPVNERDLNKNGTDEVSIIPDWFSSNWRTCNVWTLIKGKWINAVEPFSVWIGDESNEKLIEIDKKREGYVIIRYNDMGDTENAWTKKTKSVKIAK